MTWRRTFAGKLSAGVPNILSACVSAEGKPEVTALVSPGHPHISRMQSRHRPEGVSERELILHLSYGITDCVDTRSAEEPGPLHLIYVAARAYDIDISNRFVSSHSWTLSSVVHRITFLLSNRTRASLPRPPDKHTWPRTATGRLVMRWTLNYTALESHIAVNEEAKRKMTKHACKMYALSRTINAVCRGSECPTLMISPSIGSPMQSHFTNDPSPRTAPSLPTRGASSGSSRVLRTMTHLPGWRIKSYQQRYKHQSHDLKFDTAIQSVCVLSHFPARGTTLFSTVISTISVTASEFLAYFPQRAKKNCVAQVMLE
ncbi:hypothetical protein BDN67DRAFT_964945 [Paxillus ammoniavirescens]|nr:hypothetical protein BDN67DRAFT_964945 [Paxillus ammoniavirescens]